MLTDESVNHGYETIFDHFVGQNFAAATDGLVAPMARRAISDARTPGLLIPLGWELTGTSCKNHSTVHPKLSNLVRLLGLLAGTT